MRQNNQGFTFIELLLVMVIIGVLAAVAMPKFSNSIVKAHYSHAYTLIGGLQNEVAEYYGHRGEFPKDETVFTLPDSSQFGNSIGDITIKDGTISIIFKKSIESVSEDTILFTPRVGLIGNDYILFWDDTVKVNNHKEF